MDFTDAPVAETREIGEDVYFYVDANANLGSMTLEHAKETGAPEEFAYREVCQEGALFARE